MTWVSFSRSVHEDQVMVFVNRIASVIHSCVNEFFGNPNKNIGPELRTSKSTYLHNLYQYYIYIYMVIYIMIYIYWYISSLLSFFSSWEPCLRNGMAVSTEVKHFCSPGDFLITAQRSVGLEGVENGQKECNIWKYDKIWLVSIQGLGWGFPTIKITMCFWFWFSLSPGDMHCLNKMCYSAECRGRRSWQICLCSPSSRSSSFPQWSWVCKYLGFISPLHRYTSITSPVMGLIDVDPREAIQNLVAKAQINKSPLLAEYRNHPKLAKRRRRTSLKFR